MSLEEPWFCNVTIERPVFILGLQRSATTALHQTLYASTSITSLSFLEAAVPSFACRYVLQLPLVRPLISTIKAVLKSVSTKGHKASVEMLAEEHMLCPFSQEMMLVIAPNLVLCAPQHLWPRLFTVQKSDVQFVKRVLQRLMKGRPSQPYVGKPLSWAASRTTVQSVFPDMVTVRCVRPFRDCYVSHMTLMWHMRLRAYPRAFPAYCAVMRDHFLLPNASAIANMDPVDYTVQFAQVVRRSSRCC